MELLKSATQLIQYKDFKTARLFLQGDSGIGKHHISVGHAKEFMKRGRQIYVARPDSRFDARRLTDTSVVILDAYTVLMEKMTCTARCFFVFLILRTHCILAIRSAFAWVAATLLG